MRDRMTSGRWLPAALLLAGCAGPVVGAASDTKDPVDRWQAALQANAARYVCGAPLAEGGEAAAVRRARRGPAPGGATAALAQRAGTRRRPRPRRCWATSPPAAHCRSGWCAMRSQSAAAGDRQIIRILSASPNVFFFFCPPVRPDPPCWNHNGDPDAPPALRTGGGGRAGPRGLRAAAALFMIPEPAAGLAAAEAMPATRCSATTPWSGPRPRRGPAGCGSTRSRSSASARSCRRRNPTRPGSSAGASGAPGNQQAVWQELGARRAANRAPDAASLARQRGCRSGPGPGADRQPIASFAAMG